MRALILDAAGKTAAVQDVPRPSPAPNEVLIKVEAIALNPVDALYTFHPLGETGRTVGSDFCGTVITPAGDLTVGQRVAGFLQGSSSINDRPGAFAEYLVCPADLVWKVPDSVSPEQAAAINLCGLTAAQAIFYRLGLPAPFTWQPDDEQRPKPAPQEASNKPLTFFIYGASTSVGMYAAQLIRHSALASGRPLKLIGAASPARFDLLRAAPYLYDSLVDYRDADWPEQVRQLAEGGGVDFVYDCISEGQTVRKTSTTLREGGGMAIVRSRAVGAWDPEGVNGEPIYGAVWEGLGVDIQYQKFWVYTSPSKRAFAAGFYRWLSAGGGKLQANPVRVMPGGLDRIIEDGFALLGSGSVLGREQKRTEEWMKPVSGEKIVYRISS